MQEPGGLELGPGADGWGQGLGMKELVPKSWGGVGVEGQVLRTENVDTEPKNGSETTGPGRMKQTHGQRSEGT